MFGTTTDSPQRLPIRPLSDTDRVHRRHTPRPSRFTINIFPLQCSFPVAQQNQDIWYTVSIPFTAPEDFISGETQARCNVRLVSNLTDDDIAKDVPLGGVLLQVEYDLGVPGIKDKGHSWAGVDEAEAHDDLFHEADLDIVVALQATGVIHDERHVTQAGTFWNGSRNVPLTIK